MNRAQAQRMWDSLSNAERAVDAALAEIRARVSQEAGELCQSYLTDVSVRLWLHVLSPLLQEHPDLKAAEDSESDPHWRPQRIPAEEVEKVTAALAHLRATLKSNIPVVDDGAVTPGESIGYRAALVGLADAVQAASSNIEFLSVDLS